jgi:dihydrofolate synthase/folylpolyglutamate synthase
VDAAHNPDGARALAEALPGASGGKPVVACVAILADKDAAAIVAALAPGLDAVVCTRIPPGRIEGTGRPGTESIPAAALATLFEEAGVRTHEIVEEPEAAIRRALELAGERGGMALAVGSHYLLGYAWTERHVPSSSR